MSEHTLDRMVAGLMKTAAQKLEATPPEMSKVAHVPAPQTSVDDEAEKTASALEYLADCLDSGQLTTDITDLERIKQAYEIVETVEADPKLKFKIVTAMAEIPMSTGESPSISPGMGGNAMKHDLQSPPGGGATQQRATAGASGYAIPRSSNNSASMEHSATGLMNNDLNDIPGGGGAYPEKGPIRDAAVKSAFAMGSALRGSKQAGVKEVGQAIHRGARNIGTHISELSSTGGRSARKIRQAGGTVGYKNQIAKELTPAREAALKAGKGSDAAKAYTERGTGAMKDYKATLESAKGYAAKAPSEGRRAALGYGAVGAGAVGVGGAGYAATKHAEFVASLRGDGKPAKITGTHGGGPLGKPDGVSQAGENVPGGASPRQVQSNQAAIDYTQRDAKRTFVQKEVGKVLDAPILQRSADDVLEKNLTHTEVSKLASLARKELVERALRGSVQPG